MVNLYAARHRLPVPALARWLLALGIVATLAANMAQGWSHGPVGAVIAAWPAVSLVGSYELLVWIIRTAAAGDLDRGPAADQGGPQADHYGPSLRLAAAQGPDAGPGNLTGRIPASRPAVRTARFPCPGRPARARQADQAGTWRTTRTRGGPARLTGAGDAASSDSDVNAAAVAAYRASLRAGTPLSERKLAGQFGKTSRRWARNRMAEARQSAAPASRTSESADREAKPRPRYRLRGRGPLAGPIGSALLAATE